MTPHPVSRLKNTAILYEVIALAAIVLLIWIDEILDVPHILLGASATLVNWRESLLESVVIVGCGFILIKATRKIFAEVQYLEGFLVVCAWCKRIRDEQGEWEQMEAYIHSHSEAVFSHGVCPDCEDKLKKGS
jgi:Zn ribbon nucleic-acid-binding protein